MISIDILMILPQITRVTLKNGIFFKGTRSAGCGGSPGRGLLRADPLEDPLLGDKSWQVRHVVAQDGPGHGQKDTLW